MNLKNIPTSNLKIDLLSKRRPAYSDFASKQLSCKDRMQFLHSTPKLEDKLQIG